MNCEDFVLNTQVIIYDENNFLSKIIFKKRQRYVTLEDDKNISNTSNKIDFEGDKNNEIKVWIKRNQKTLINKIKKYFNLISNINSIYLI